MIHDDPNIYHDELTERRLFDENPDGFPLYDTCSNHSFTEPSKPLIHFLDLMEYEAGSTTFVESVWYRIFPYLFHKKCINKYNRYKEFIKSTS